jgi:hypothetical protein
MTVRRDPGVDLYWIPLGAGGHSVRFNGIVYEAIAAGLQHRPRLDIHHAALAIDLPDGHYMVEMTPVPDHAGQGRGVVAEGPVGTHLLGHLRLFRYEIRRWRDGVVPDLDCAVASPVRVTNDHPTAQRIFDLVPDVPTPVWGRDELRTGDMWSCNSVISWTLTRAGLDIDAIPLPAHARAPGWHAGTAVARRDPTPGLPLALAGSGCSRNGDGSSTATTSPTEPTTGCSSTAQAVSSTPSP